MKKTETKTKATTNTGTKGKTNTGTKKNVNKPEGLAKVVSSIRIRVMAALTCATLLLAVLISAMTVPTVQDETGELITDYMVDTVEALGTTLDYSLQIEGLSRLFDTDYLENVLKDVQVSDYKGSYAYVVNSLGMMLWHPDETKINKPVENSVIKAVIPRLKKETDIPTTSVEYEYKGDEKYAAYYVGLDNRYILVITTDKSETNSITNAILIRTVLAGILMVVILDIAAAFMLNSIFKVVNGVGNLVNDMAAYNISDNKNYDKYASAKNELNFIANAARGLRMSLVTMISAIMQGSNRVMNNSNDMVRSIQSAGNNVNGISIAMDEIAQGATMMAENVQNTAGAMSDMGEDIDTISYEAERSKDVLANTVKMSNEAKDELHKLTDANTTTVEITKQVVDGINDSDEAIKKINMAIDIIMEIADQTNLLSLNASIEAARAGEVGKGFAVVAGEIKNLAEQSNRSAQEIQKIIETVTETSKMNLQYAGEISNAVENEKSVMDSVLTRFDAVNVNVSETVKSFDKIDSLVVRLNEAKGRILEDVEQLSSISEENAASTQETTAAATELNGILEDVLVKINELSGVAENLNDEVKRWKL